MERIAPQSGTAFRLRAGDTLCVVDPLGEQVSDLFAFAASDLAESLSSGRSLDYAETLFLTTGHVLYSNRSRPMFTIVRDTVGRHDFLLTPCSQETFEIIYGVREPHPSCFGNLRDAFAPYGVTPDAIGTTFNIFMNVELEADGALAVRPPRSRAGDTIELRAEMDLIVGLTACSAEMSNNYAFKPIDWSVRHRLAS
ncbi:MAG: urea carboxylase-associated family protein [Vulcanimicrobiaceae bacterium]